MEISVKHIRPIGLGDLDRLFEYLNKQLLEIEEEETPLFQPISRKNLSLPEEKKQSFSQGLSIPVGQPGWRRVWVAISENAEILGHIDVRGHHESYTEHRAMLGMGVNKSFRRRGLGKSLIETVVSWAISESSIEWIDLWVLSHNIPAVKLYRHTGFEQLGKVDDMFRIDGVSQGYIMMTKKIQ